MQETPSTAPNSGRTAATKQQPEPVAKTSAAAAVVEEEEEEDKYVDQRKLLSKVQSILSKRRHSKWLSDAVDVMREFVKISPVEDAGEHEELSKHAKKIRKDWKKFTIRVLETLRTALLEEAAKQEEQPPRFLKALKKLTKRNGDLTRFYEYVPFLMVVFDEFCVLLAELFAAIGNPRSFWPRRSRKSPPRRRRSWRRAPRRSGGSRTRARPLVSFPVYLK